MTDTTSRFVPGGPVHQRQKLRRAIERLATTMYPEDVESVLEDILLQQQMRKRRKPRPKLPKEKHPPRTRGELFWKRIEAYCTTHPTESGVHDPGTVAAALAPDGQRGRLKVYVTVKRRSPQSDRGCTDPRFVMVEKNHFRLYDPKKDGNGQHP